MRYGIITSVIKRQIHFNNDLTRVKKCKTSDLESTILKSRRLL